MSAEAVGTNMPPQLTLADVAAMDEVDEHHRYELSPDGALYVEEVADPEHAKLVSRLFAWFLTNGFGPEEVVVDVGIVVGGRGGRVPDLTVWAPGKPPLRSSTVYAGTDGLLLAVEVASPATAAIDRVIKRAEYAQAGIPRYWLVARDAGNTVTRLALDPATGEYAEEDPRTQPLAWLLGSDPRRLVDSIR